jgi:hypothetical protein
MIGEFVGVMEMKMDEEAIPLFVCNTFTFTCVRRSVHNLDELSHF